MGSEQVVLYCIKGNTFIIFFFLFSIKKLHPFRETDGIIYDFMIVSFFKKKADAKGTSSLERNVITFYQVKLPCFMGSPIKIMQQSLKYSLL